MAWTVVLGAGSPIGRAVAEACARRGDSVVFAGRDLADLERSALDLQIRLDVPCRAIVFDALAPETHADFLDACAASVEAPDRIAGYAWCIGLMPEEDAMRQDHELRERMIATNYHAALSILEPAAERMAETGGGWIAGLSSVAGDRGRASNALYGSSKAALSGFLSGLRARWAARNVRVIDVKPGFVDTAMTYGRPGTFLVAAPERVARDLLRGVERNRAVVYTPWFWRWIMLVIRALPDAIFLRLGL